MLGAAGLAAGVGVSNFVVGDSSQVASAAAAVTAKGRSPLSEPDLVLATDGSDQTAVLQNAINAAMAPGGSGSIRLAHNGRAVIKGQIRLPNDGASPPKQAPLLIIGNGASAFGQDSAPVGGTILDMQYPGTLSNCKIDTRGNGQLAMEHLTLMDTADGTAPFLHTTNTTIKLEDVCFYGKNKAPTTQDAIILGDTDLTPSGLFTAPFQGYGTVICHCYFNNIRTVVRGNSFANGVTIEANTVWQECGGDSTHGCIHFGGVPAGAPIGGWVTGNLIEASNYVYPVILDQSAGYFTLLGNNFYDQNGSTLAYVRCTNNANSNLIITGQYNAGGVPMLSEDASSLNKNSVWTAGQAQPVVFAMNPINVEWSGSQMRDLVLNEGPLKFTNNTPSIDTAAGLALNFMFNSGTGQTVWWHAGSQILTVLTSGQLQTASGNETTGSGSAALGSNSPAVTNNAPYTWEKITVSDGSQCYFPVWK
jgi:hypothetical protein